MSLITRLFPDADPPATVENASVFVEELPEAGAVAIDEDDAYVVTKDGLERARRRLDAAREAEAAGA